MQRQYLSPLHAQVNADGQNVEYMRAAACEVGHEFFFFFIRQVSCNLIVFTKKFDPFTWITLNLTTLNCQIKGARKQLNFTDNRGRNARLMLIAQYQREMIDSWNSPY